MKQQNKLFIFGITLVIASFATAVFAMTFYASDYILKFHLYLNKSGQLVVNRDYQLQYESDEGPFEPEVIQDQSKAYHADILDANNNLLSVVKFDPRKGQANYVGPVDVYAPYYTRAKSAKFYDNLNKFILAVDTSNTLSCIVDKTCDLNAGESQYSCPEDCGTPPSDVSPSPSNVVFSVSPTAAPTSEGSSNLLWILLVVGGLVIAGLVTLVIIRKRRQEPPIPPSLGSGPSIPPTPLP